MTSGHFVQKCRAAGIFPLPAFRLSGGGELTATTRLITHHISKGETVAQSLKDRFDYGQNPEKTQGGELISAYECDHRTADAEFLLAKAKYKAVTGREQRRDADVLCYQIRQSFLPVSYTHLDVYKRQVRSISWRGSRRPCAKTARASGQSVQRWPGWKGSEQNSLCECSQ